MRFGVLFKFQNFTYLQFFCDIIREYKNVVCSSPVVVLNINSKKYFTTHTKKRMNQKEKKNLKLIKFRLNMNSVIFALIWFSSCRRRVHFAINLRSLYLCLAIFFLVSFYRMLVLCCARMKVRLCKCMCFVYASLLLRIFILLKKHGNWTSKQSQDSPCFLDVRISNLRMWIGYANVGCWTWWKARVKPLAILEMLARDMHL